MLKVILLFISSLMLFAQTDQPQTDQSWYSRINVKVEAGLYLPLEGGTIENIQGTSDFSKDFAYNRGEASYFSLEVVHDYDYVPNLYISYFNMQDSQSATLTKTVQVASKDFSSDVLSTIDYHVFEATVSQDFLLKGNTFTFLGSNYYTGDLEFDVGLSAKLFHWYYEVKDLSNTSRSPAWIKADESIPSPYLGIKYFLYNFNFYANASDLAFSRAKSSTYRAGIDYRVTSSLYLNAAYIYEEFDVVEKKDKIDFKTSGYKFGFKYEF